jgi:glycosyltransferase involved in cell wall biosynthesis
MNNLYSCLDYYLVTSRCEGGPQTILEAMATKTPVYSTQVGISNLLAEEVVFSSADEFINALKGEYPADVIETHYKTAQWYECSKIINIYEKTLTKISKLYYQNREGFFQYVTGFNWGHLR